MTEPARAPQGSPREQQLEKALRDILGPLDRRLESFNTVMGLIVIVVIATVLGLLWQVWDFRWWAALLWAGGAVMVVAMVLVFLEPLVVRPSVAAFNQRFPETSRERDDALDLLREMQSPNKAEEKLLAAV